MATDAGILTPERRRKLVQRVFACGFRRDLDELTRQIARTYASSPQQRAANAEQLDWLRPVIQARRAHLGKV